MQVYLIHVHKVKQIIHGVLWNVETFQEMVSSLFKNWAFKDELSNGYLRKGDMTFLD